MSLKIALLSNVNINGLNRILSKEYEIWQGEGYDNIFETLYNPASSFYSFHPEFVFLFIDIAELLAKNCIELDYSDYKYIITNWFEQFDSIRKPNCTYVISNADYSEYVPLTVNDSFFRGEVESYWENSIIERRKENSNLYPFDIKSVCNKIGSSAFYDKKLWYLGGIKYSNHAAGLLCEEISSFLYAYENHTKKVLILDLDNTLWGGVIGEDGIDGIKLSNSNVGRIYKDVQYIIKRLKQNGILLCICSKNNESDVFAVFENHPHMVLQKDDFAAYKINWENKAENIQKIAVELNLGLDSFVFLDDNPAEQQLIHQILPMVTVPDFPNDLKIYPNFMADLVHRYFYKLSLTEEDIKKTKIYQENKKRQELKSQVDYSAYLKQLECRVSRIMEPVKHVARISQLINKTNQFNLTTIRYSEKEIIEMLADNQYRFYLFQCSDRFGDNGIIALIVVHINENIPTIHLFTMSCRVMGRQLEQYILEVVEKDIESLGFKKLKSFYIFTEKSAPVEMFYDSMGYKFLSNNNIRKNYEIDFSLKKEREYFIKE